MTHRLWAHMRRLWPRWTLLPAAPFVVYSLFRLAQGDFRWEIIAALVIAPTLAYASAGTKRLFVLMYPLLLVGILYDGMGPLKNLGLTESNVHVCDLQALERNWFGVGSGEARATLPDYWQHHAEPALFVAGAVPYGTFIFAILGYGVYLYFRDKPALQQYAWTFLILNVLGFATYHIYPAAPPWYIHQHGCAVDLNAAASEGYKLAAVDRMMGFNYFSGFYGRSNDIFGAVPSLHVAYALLILLVVWTHHRWFGRALASIYLVLMVFGALYLAHHWVIDSLLGMAYCVVVFFGVGAVQRWLGERRQKRPAVAPAEAAPRSLRSEPVRHAGGGE